jgi:hypothetical protein
MHYDICGLREEKLNETKKGWQSSMPKHCVHDQKLESKELIIPSPHLLVLATTERFLPARGTFRAILASESHWLQPMLVLSVRWWPAPAGVGRVLVYGMGC